MATQIPLNPLSAFFQGFQGAQTKAQQAQQQAAENELTRQLREVQLLNAQRQLAEASKTPQERFAEQFAQSVALEALKSGAATRSPVGLEGQTIYEPFPIDQTASQLAALEAVSQAPDAVDQAALSNLIAQQIAPGEVAGVPRGTNLGDAMSTILGGQLPSAEIPVPVVPRTPFVAPRGRQAQVAMPLAAAPGFISSPAAQRTTEQAELEALGRRLDVTGNKKAIGIVDGQVLMQDTRGNLTKEQIPGSQMAGPGAAAPLEIRPLTTRPGTGRELTPNARATILAKAGTAGITREQIDAKYTKDGVTDYDQIILDSNRTISQDKKLAAEEKSKQIPATDRSKATGFIAAYDDLNSLVNTVKTFQVQGAEPGAWSRAVGTALEQPPDGVFSALYQSAIGQSLTADDRQLNALKARVRGAVTKANAGLSQTEREIANVTQYVPTTNDNFEQTLQKAAGLQDYIKNQVTAITTDPRDWLKSLEETPMATAPQPASVTTAPITIKSIRRKQ